MEYLRNFDTLKDYEGVEKSLRAPNISFIEETKKCKYKPEKYSKIGDIVLYDKDLDEFLYVSPEGYQEMYWQNLRYEPIGVVAVGTKYTPDHSTRVVSLKNMSLKDPENGSIANGIQNDNIMYWGNNDADIQNLKNRPVSTKVNPLTGETTGYSSWVRLPSDLSFNSTGYVDPLSGYRYCFNNYINDPNCIDESKDDRFGPFPVLKNGEKNPQYYDPKSATSDFNGPENTDIILKMAIGTPYENWRSDILINNYESGNYPTIFCCRRYKTPGTKSGDWYLPASGELLFLSTFYGTINKGLLTLTNNSITIGRNSTIGNWYWSSTVFNNSMSKYIQTYPGYISYIDKIYIDVSNRTRAFLKLD